MKKLITLLLAACMLLTLAACGGTSDEPPAGGNDTPGTQDTPGSSGTTTEDGKVVLNIGISTAPSNISPFTSFTNRQPVQNYLYENLMARDPDGNWYGIIAKDWTTEDNITYDIEIYDYVYDNAGNQIKAEDVAYSLIHARDEAANTWIADAEATGEYTVRLTLIDDQVSTLPTAIQRAPICSKASFEASEDGMTTTSVSSAPYIVTDFVPNVSISFEKNPNYWQKDESLQNPLYKTATVDTMNFIKISEAAQQSIALETGTIDAYYQISTTELENFFEGGRDYGKFDVIDVPSQLCYILYFGTEGYGADINFRKAVAYAINSKEIVVGAMAGYGIEPTFQGAPGGISDLTPTSASADYFAQDLDKAKEYLAQSSYKGEEIVFLCPNEPNHANIATIVLSQLQQIGISCKLNTYDNALFQADFATHGAFDIAVCQMGAGDIALVWSFLSANYANFGMGVDDPAFDALLAEIMSIDTHTTETATKVSDYINDNVYGVNLAVGADYYVFKKELGAKEIPLVNQASYPISSTIFE